MTGKPPRLYHPASESFVDLTSYEALLGREAWRRLHPDIRERFCRNRANRDVVYQGVMREVSASIMGKLLAQMCRLIGTPLTYLSGQQIPICVKVYRDQKLQGMTWDRYYYFPKGRINRVRSTKCIQPGSGLIEVVGGGFGMFLKVFEDKGVLCFTSTRFFFSIGKIKIPIPHLFTPGRTTVRQAALDDNRFEFSLTIQHSLFGTVIRQVGIFREAG